MDQNHDGTLTFQEFLVYQGITSPSSDVVDVEDLIKRNFKKIKKTQSCSACMTKTIMDL
jgi:hypothetical protein